MSKEIVPIEGQVTFSNQVTVPAGEVIDMALVVGRERGQEKVLKVLKELLLQNARKGTRSLLEK